MTGWFRGVGYRLLPVITGLIFSACVSLPAPAAEINLSDLRGYSIESQWNADRRITRVETSGQKKRFRGRIRYVDKIYISKTGRIFQRRQGYIGSSTKPTWGGDFVRGRGNDFFDWGPNSTFVHRSIPSDDKEKTTYLRIVRIALSQSGGSYSCSVKASLALKKGEKQYVNYKPSGRYQIIHSFKARQKYCRVYKGNVFKGEVKP